MGKKLILALDGVGIDYALTLTTAIGKSAYAVKVHDVVDDYGPRAIANLKAAGARKVWVDYKLHDIPKTVGKRAQALKNAGADIVTVHASGGADMVRAAVDTGLEVFAVTALTSLSPKEIVETYAWNDAQSAVRGLTVIAFDGGASGVVCSGQEVAFLRQNLIDLDSFKLVVPGTRSFGVDAGDQKRVTTPREALDAGATHLVIASQVTAAKDPVAAWDSLLAEINA